MIDLARARTLIHTRGPAFAAEIGVNFVAPYVIYTLAAPHYGDVRALLASSLPPILWSIAEFVRHRRLDAVALLVLAGIVLSLLAFFGGGGPRMLQLREKLVTGIIGVAFLVSAAIRRPLMYHLGRAVMKRRGSAEAEHMEGLRDVPGFRRAMTVMTVVWGFGLIVDVAIATALVFTLTIRQYMLVNQIVSYAIIGCLFLWTWRYSRRRRAIGEAARGIVRDSAGTPIPQPPAG